MLSAKNRTVSTTERLATLMSRGTCGGYPIQVLGARFSGVRQSALRFHKRSCPDSDGKSNHPGPSVDAHDLRISLRSVDPRPLC